MPSKLCELACVIRRNLSGMPLLSSAEIGSTDRTNGEREREREEGRMRWSWIWPRGNKARGREGGGAIDGQVQFESLGQNYCPERTDRHRHRRSPIPTSLPPALPPPSTSMAQLSSLSTDSMGWEGREDHQNSREERRMGRAEGRGGCQTKQ